MRIVLLLLLLDSLVIVWGSPLGTPSDAPFKVNVASGETGKEYQLNLVKPQSSVIHPNVQIITVVSDEHTGQLDYQRWTPSKEDFEAATRDVHIDPQNLAAVKVTFDNHDGRPVLEGVVNGMKLRQENGIPRLFPGLSNLTSDYIALDNDVLLEPSTNFSSVDQYNDVPLIVEIAVVCDMDFGKVFNFNRQRILEYWTVNFWDINMRFKTLPSSDISLRVTSIIVIATPSGQPFIEDARVDGIISYNRVLPLLGTYMYNQMETLPKFDMAMAVTNAPVEWYGGLAVFRGACQIWPVHQVHMGVMVYSDHGGYSGVSTAAHEMAHVLGAPHDLEMEGCEDSGYIMSGHNFDLRFYFSSCSDRAIQHYVSTPYAACLRQVDEPGEPPINPGFSSAETPTMTEQCRAMKGNPSAFVTDEDTALCVVTNCSWLQQGVPRRELMAPLQNSPCLGGGRCFHGRCLPTSYRLLNLGSWQCVRRSNGFTYNDEPQIVTCPILPTPLDKFMILNDVDGNPSLLGTPFIIPAHTSLESADKCLSVNEENDVISFDRCESPANQNSIKWEFVLTGYYYDFLLRHKLTKKCAQQTADKIIVTANCDMSDRSQLWRLI